MRFNNIELLRLAAAVGVCIVGAFALLIGLSFGRLELLMHGRLKRWADGFAI